jgi:sugar/nucleoside kinase (ribokinase family)
LLVAELACGSHWIEAARRPNAADAIKVTRRGRATAPTAAELDALLAPDS